MSVKSQPSAKAAATPATSLTPARTGLLQRQCACGGAPGLTGECAECGEKRLTVQSQAAAAGSPLAAYDMLREPGQPPGAATGDHLGPRRGHDFRRVRVHKIGREEIQTKLFIGQAGDKYEQEADQTAEMVMRKLTAPAPRQVEGQSQPLRARRLSVDDKKALHRQAIDEEEKSEEGQEREEEEENLQTKSFSSEPPKPSGDLEARIQSRRGAGDPMSQTARALFEPHFGYDFSEIRIHADPDAAEASRSLNAAAFTTGKDIFFASSRYDPYSAQGQRLLAHELTHTLQQNQLRPLSGFQNEIDAAGDSAAAFVDRRANGGPDLQLDGPGPPAGPASQSQPAALAPASTVNIRWRGSVRLSVFEFVRAWAGSEEEAARITSLVLDHATSFTLADGRSVTRQEFEQATHDHFVLDENLTSLLTRELGQSVEQMRARAEAQEIIEGLTDAIRSATLPGERPEEEERQAAPSTPTQPNWRIMEGNEPLARVYLRLMEHFAGLRLTDEVNALAEGGLAEDELIGLIGSRPRLRHFTNLFTQGFQEFQRAGGAELDAFSVLEERIMEQTVWGNPSATNNQLRIGIGWPEDQLGIVDRGSGMLYYDPQGMPLRSPVGLLWRDEGFVGAPPREDFIINIATIDDPGLRMMLNILRVNFGDPTRMVARAAEIYFENVELVNQRVEEGLTDEVKQKFVDSLPIFIGFLAGHGITTLLLRSPNPVAIAIGGALKALLVGAGYVLQISFAGSALERLLEAATHLSRVREVESGELTELSQYYLDRAAEPIRSMVADVAMTAITIGLTQLAGATIRCTRCRFSSRERRARTRQQRRRGEGQQLGFTRAQIDAIRRAIVRRARITEITGQRHRGAEGHGVPDATLIRTVNNPQVILLARNGNWVFYRNGTIVITPRNNPSFINTAFGRGATVPQRRLADLRALYPQLNLQIGSPEPPVNLAAYISQQAGEFSVFRIWP